MQPSIANTPGADLSRHEVIPFIEDLYARRGEAKYGEGISQLAHALQAAVHADQRNDPPSLVAAALLHDIAHLFHEDGLYHAEHGIDAHHETLGADFLQQHFVDACVEPVRLHVAAKRYLCATEPGYRDGLSAGSELSLMVQGGPMSEAEVKAFEENPHLDAALRLRRYDEASKVDGLDTPPFSTFKSALEAALKPE